MRRKAADGIRCGGIAGQQGGLAPTAAKIDCALGTFPTRQRHPRLAPETIETFRFIPDLLEGLKTNIFKFEIWNTCRVRTGKHMSRGIHRQVLHTPTLHARLGSVLEIIREDLDDFHAAL